MAILGPNGAGKSTFLKLLSGQLRPEAKPQTVCRLFGETFWDIDSLRKKIGVVMPEEVSCFHPRESAFDVVLSSLRGAYGKTNRMRFTKAERELCRSVIAEVSMSACEDRLFGELSSGEQRRFLIARALIHRPAVIVLDEPSTALDLKSNFELSQLLRRLAREGQTLVWVTHHPGEIPPEIPRCILFKNSRVIADGPSRKTLTSDTLSTLYGITVKARWAEGWCHVRSA